MPMMPIQQFRFSLAGVVAVSLTAFAMACGRKPEHEVVSKGETEPALGTVYTVRDTTVTATFEASGVAAPVRQATLSTKLMGTVTEVLVKEGEVVSAGQPLVRIDARDLAARTAQVGASIAEAEAVYRDALTQANRIRALYADSAATRAQLDGAETGLARAQAGFDAAKAASVELSAVTSYSVIRAPFSGVVTRRFVDPGAFAAPGAPLVAVQDASRLRITASVTPDIAARLRRGQPLPAVIEDSVTTATVEGVVPASAGNLYVINALVPNGDRTHLAGSTATLSVPTGTRSTLVVPAAAVVRQGDLTGVTLRVAAGDEVRWVRLGAPVGAAVEVAGGLQAGDRVIVPTGRVASACGER